MEPFVESSIKQTIQTAAGKTLSGGKWLASRSG